MPDELKLQTNIPEQVMLKFAAPKEFPSKYGDAPRCLFTLTDGRGLWLSQYDAAKITDLHPAPGQLVELCRREKTGTDGRKWIELEARPVGNGNGHGALAVPKLDGNGSGNAPAAPPAAPHPAFHNGTAQAILQTSQVLVDVMAATLKYARTQHGELVSPDDVRSLVITAFINAGKGGMLL